MSKSAPSKPFAPVTEAGIRQMTDSGSFSRGQSYFRNGHIQQPEIRDATILAECEGSYDVPYRVQATLRRIGEEGENPASFDCTCPVEGFCKHLVALLLTWIDNPLAFAVREPVSVLLAGRDRDELVALIGQMVELHPDLQTLVELPVAKPGKDAARTAEVRDTTIKRQIDAIFRSYDSRAWGSAGVIASALEKIGHQGDAYAQAGRWADAQVVYTVLAEFLMDWLRNGGYDHDGDIAGVIGDCDAGLASCLEAQAELPESQRLPQAAREDLIRTMYDIWRYDMFELGDLDIGGAGLDALVGHGTADECERVEGWLDKEGAASPWAIDMLTDIRIMLRESGGKKLSDDELLEVYLKNRHWKAAAMMQAHLGRVDDAFATVAGHKFEPRDLIEIAGQVIEDHPDLRGRTIEMIETRYLSAPGNQDSRMRELFEWLIRQKMASGNAKGALDLVEKSFLQHATLASFRAIEQMATRLDPTGAMWQEHREHALDQLKQKGRWALVAEIHVQAGEIRAALDAYSGYRQAGSPRLPRSDDPIIDSAWVLRLTSAAEQDFPVEVAGLYAEQAEKHIAQRRRNDYQTAAEWLLKAMMVLESHDQEAMAKQLVGDIRRRYANLRGLLRELDSLGVN